MWIEGSASVRRRRDWLIFGSHMLKNLSLGTQRSQSSNAREVIGAHREECVQFGACATEEATLSQARHRLDQAERLLERSASA